jgi:uncharacterized protein YndB with AHSA1/START domain
MQLMVADSIEREIRIDAPPDVVWRVITEPRHIERWFADEADLDARSGGDGQLAFTHSPTGRHLYRLRVVLADRPHRFVYRWMHPEGASPTDANSVLVEFTLTPEGDGTRLRVVESGIRSLEWPADEKSGYVDDHKNGWVRILERLRDYAAEVAGGR